MIQEPWLYKVDKKRNLASRARGGLRTVSYPGTGHLHAPCPTDGAKSRQRGDVVSKRDICGSMKYGTHI